MKTLAVACLAVALLAGSAMGHDHYFGSRPTFSTPLRFGYDYAYPRYRLLDVYGGYGFAASRSSYYGLYGVPSARPSYYPRVSGYPLPAGSLRFGVPAYSSSPSHIKFIDTTGTLRHINP